jgi:peptidyl-tRNA hydrolase, PTH1 family
MWLIAGLGNPGRKYSRTRHNVGFMALEELARKFRIDFAVRRQYRLGRGSMEGNKILLLEPLLFMNLSGHVVKDVCRRFGIQFENLVVIHDDLDMEAGKLRIRKTGSSGGHKGVESIIQSIGSRDFIRVKAGIGRDPSIPAEEYVLRKFTRQEISVIKDMIDSAADAVHSIISQGVDRAMNKFN